MMTVKLFKKETKGSTGIDGERLAREPGSGELGLENQHSNLPCAGFPLDDSISKSIYYCL